MIGSGFMSSSSWNPETDPDFFIIPDGPLIDGSFVFDKHIEDSIIESLNDFGKSSCSVSPNYPSSDDCYSRFDNADLLSLPVPDVPTAELFKYDEFGIMDFSDLEMFSSNETEENIATDSAHMLSSSPEVPRKKLKKAKSSKRSSNSKSWSRMSMEEQFETAHALSQIISHHLGLTEQLEVIKLINPSVVLSKNDTDFTINLSLLNNAKLKRIKDYVKKHVRQQDGIENNFQDILSTPSSNSSSCHPPKRKQKKSKSTVLKELSVRQKKVIQQDRKEKRSGLFVKEKIIKKLSNPEEEQEEVNILE